MTCDDCVHIKKSKSLDENFNRTEHWFCSKMTRNIKLIIEYSEVFRLKNPNAPLSILQYDKSKMGCVMHKSGGVPLDTFTSKDSNNKDNTENKSKLPENRKFLERD